MVVGIMWRERVDPSRRASGEDEISYNCPLSLSNQEVSEQKAFPLGLAKEGACHSPSMAPQPAAAVPVMSSLTLPSFEAGGHRSGRGLLFADKAAVGSEGTDASTSGNLPTVSGTALSQSRQQAVPQYGLRGRIGQGSFGEVWKGFRCAKGRVKRCPANSGSDKKCCADGQEQQFVLKRLLAERGKGRVKLSGMREIYFGSLIKDWQESASAGVVKSQDYRMEVAEGLQHLASSLWYFGS